MNVNFIFIIFLLLNFNIGLAQNVNHTDNGQYNKISSESFDLKFPRDHNAHKEFKVEWWYITANLKNENGDSFGIQWTLFRSRSELDNNKATKHFKNPWISDQVWMAHAAVTTEDGHYYEEKFSRGDTGQSGVELSPFLAWIDDWEFSSNNDWSKASLKANGKQFSYELNLESEGPLILHGDDGKSIKTKDGHFSAYYSQPFFKIEGKLIINNKSFDVQGNAWADREWSNAILGPNQEGWDWISIHLDDETKLMIFRVRDSQRGDFYSGTFISDQKQKISLEGKDIKMKPLKYFNRKKIKNKKKSKVPIEWNIVIKSHGIDLKLKALNKNSFVDTLVPYWEGPIILSGSHQGFGYLEMTGY